MQLHKIAMALLQVILKHSLQSQMKAALSEILEIVKRANIASEHVGSIVSIEAVKALHLQFKDDL